MLHETRSLVKELARTDAEIQQLWVSVGNFSVQDAYRPFMDSNYGFSPFSNYLQQMFLPKTLNGTSHNHISSICSL